MRLIILAALAAASARAGTIAELVQSIRAALAAKRADTEVATMVAQAKLDERLTGAVIEQLESEGAGPRTVEELEWQREESSALSIPRELRPGDVVAPPSDGEQARMIEQARAVALAYTANLPNFLCTETVRRHGRPNGKPWRLNDTLTVDLAYSEQGESYKLLTINGKPTTKTFRSLSGWRTNGEFGSLLKFIYEAKSDARFQWERWGNLRGRRVAVFSYRIDRKKSTYSVDGGRSMFSHARIVTGAVGFVYIDPETQRTMRLSAGDDGLPPNFPIRETWLLMDYDYADVGGQLYLLPRRVDVRAIFRESRGRSIEEFGNYRKFSSEATVTFEK